MKAPYSITWTMYNSFICVTYPQKNKNYQFFRLACFVCLFFSSVFCSSFVLLFFFGWESDSLSLLRWSIMWLCARLDWAESGVFSSGLKVAFSVLCFHAFFFSSCMSVKSHGFIVQETKNTVHALFTHCSCTVHEHLNFLKFK